MGRTKSVAACTNDGLERAWAEGGEEGVVRAAIVKYARVIDMTESGRDMKPLITGMFDAIDRLKAIEAAGGQGAASTPLFEVLELARTG